MSPARMHEDEVHTDAGLVRRLLRAQFPQWAELPIEPVFPRGTDNGLFRLGDTMVARLPRIDWAVASREKEHEWLPKLSPLLPFEIPEPLALGEPGEGYPWRWSVYRWLEGEDPSVDLGIDRDGLLPDLVRFVKAMHELDLAGGPPDTPRLAFDEATRRAIDLLGTSVDRSAALAAWEDARAAPPWTREPVWVHGDLDARNLLVRGGRLTGVLDWGGVGVGDPACDVAVGWKVLSPDARERFRSELDVDDAMWRRARGWTLSQAVNALSYYTPENNHELVREARRWLVDVLADQT